LLSFSYEKMFHLLYCKLFLVQSRNLYYSFPKFPLPIH